MAATTSSSTVANVTRADPLRIFCGFIGGSLSLRRLRGTASMAVSPGGCAFVDKQRSRRIRMRRSYYLFAQNDGLNPSSTSPLAEMLTLRRLTRFDAGARATDRAAQPTQRLTLRPKRGSIRTATRPSPASASLVQPTFEGD
jgi:hypothetical protein